MRLSSRDLHHLPVETQSGRSLGRLIDWEIDSGTQEIRTYHVQTKSLVPGLFADTLLVDRRQVILLTDEKLVVDDAVTLGEAETQRIGARPVVGPSGS